MVLGKLGRVEEALAIQEQVTAVAERVLEPDDTNLLRARNGLATSLRQLGHFDRALELQLSMLETLERTHSPDSREFLGVCMNTAATYLELGELLEARQLGEQAVEGIERLVGEDSFELAQARSNLAVILYQMGDAEGALALQQRVVSVMARLLPPDHPDALITREVLGALYLTVGDATRTRELFEELVATYEARFDPAHAWTLRARENLAGALRELGRFDGAITETGAVLEQLERVQPEGPRVDAVRLGHGAALLGLGDTSAALELLERVVRDGSLPASSRFMSSARRELVYAAVAEGDLARARAVALELADSLVTHLRRAAISSAPREAEAATMESMASIDAVLCRTDGAPLVEAGRVLELVESSRGTGLVSHRLARVAAEASSELARMRVAIDRAAVEVNALALGGKDPDEFSNAVARMEAAERSLRDAIGARGVAPPDVTAAALSSTLGEDEAAVSFWRYVAHSPEHGRPFPGPADEARWIALVVRPDSSVRRVELGAASALEDAIAGWRATLALGAGSLRGLGVSGSATRAERAGQRLRARLVDPWLDALGGARRVHVVPFGELNRVPLDALPLDEAGERLLGDELVLSNVDSLGELLVARSEPNEQNGLLAFGGIEYAADAAPGFEPLPATRDEVLQLAQLHATALPDAPRVVLTGANATAAAFSAHVRGARWLHVATHGWFAPDSIPSVRREREANPGLGLTSVVDLRENVQGFAPSLLCGLAFAGFGGASEIGSRPEGMLTGADIARLDLEACELAVLSACESGVGELRAGQGLASLRRALHAAGARNVVSSLWQVPDEATRELMIELYRRRWVDHEPLANALWGAKRALRERGRPASDWAGWILSGS